MKIAVTGALGQLGGELCRQIGPQAIPLDIDTLDLTDGKAVQDMLPPLRPEAIINCAAYTQVDKAEKEPDLAHAVNAAAVEHLVSVCRELGCPLVQISTDYVFSGERVQDSTSSSIKPRPLVALENCPYREDDPTTPQGVYARTKLEGERAAARYEKHIIVRTCGLYARPSDNRANNFVKTMLRLGSTRSELGVVADQYCTPSYVPHVARAILFLTGVHHPSPCVKGDSPIFVDTKIGTVPAAAPWGIYHVTNTGATNWHDFAEEIFRLAGMNVSVKAITTAEYGAPAARPSYSVLDTAAYHSLGGPPMPDWKTALEEYISEWRRLQIAN